MAPERVYIGIDPTVGKRLLTYAVIDEDLDVLSNGDVSFEGILEAVTAYPDAVCAVDAPSGPNLGLMAEPGYREGLGLKPNSSRYSSFRVGEYELRRRAIGLYRTPRDPEDAPEWMKLGWQLHDALREAGYVRYPHTGPRQVIEVHPHACFTMLLGKRPYKKNSFEGRLQRQLILYEEGLDVEDPMGVFEEWTRHRVLSSELPLDEVHKHDRLDALVAAYTAFLVAEEPQRTTSVGDPAEGTIIVPSGSLRESYL
jgi:predicted nuclease with RNAse H fold